MIQLSYSNTNTFFLDGLLVDTGYAGSLRAFYRALKGAGIGIKDIRYVMATHYHPDHMGLIGELTRQGVRLLLADVQRDHTHFSDRIFEREHIGYIPIDESAADVFPVGQSRAFLADIGIGGELVRTPSHSEDSVALITDNGDCFVGDLEPYEYIEAYGSNQALQRDWDTVLAHRPKRIYFAHRPEMILC